MQAVGTIADVVTVMAKIRPKRVVEIHEGSSGVVRGHLTGGSTGATFWVVPQTPRSKECRDTERVCKVDFYKDKVTLLQMEYMTSVFTYYITSSVWCF